MIFGAISPHRERADPSDQEINLQPVPKEELSIGRAWRVSWDGIRRPLTRGSGRRNLGWEIRKEEFVLERPRGLHRWNLCERERLSKNCGRERSWRAKPCHDALLLRTKLKSN